MFHTCSSFRRKNGSFFTIKSLGPLWHPSAAATAAAAVAEAEPAPVAVAPLVAPDVAVVLLAQGNVTNDGNSPPLLPLPLPLLLSPPPPPLPLLPVALA
jgi:hypothetical protein